MAEILGRAAGRGRPRADQIARGGAARLARPSWRPLSRRRARRAARRSSSSGRRSRAPPPAEDEIERAIARGGRGDWGTRRRGQARRRNRSAAQRALSPGAWRSARKGDEADRARTHAARQRSTARRRRAERRGRLAEWLCLWHLRLRGWHIVARGWRCPAGEIDIVARRGKVLAIIEVKSRGEVAVAANALAPRQRRRIARAAEALLDVASRSRRPRCAIRRDAGRTPAAAAALARRLAHLTDSAAPPPSLPDRPQPIVSASNIRSLAMSSAKAVPSPLRET